MIDMVTTEEAVSARISRLKERAIERGNKTEGRPGARAVALMQARSQHPRASWAEYRAYTHLAFVRLNRATISEDEELVGTHLFNSDSQALDWGDWGPESEIQLARTDFTAKTKEQLRQFLPRYAAWKETPLSGVGEDPRDVRVQGGVWDAGCTILSGWTANHSIRDFAKALRIGFDGIRREITAEIAASQPWDADHVPRIHNWRAMVAICDAGCELGKIYEKTAEALAAAASDSHERYRLQRIAETCRQVPARGARTLREATQALWFAHVLSCGEDRINANSIGRLDSILEPYYQADMRAGCIDREEAIELMQELACKLYLDYDVQQICLGGQSADGADASNEMTHIILEATERLDFIRCISVRLHKNTPDPLIKRVARMAAAGGGIPFFFNDEAIIPALTRRGIALDDARNYAPIGCVEITVPGKATPHAVSGWLNAAGCLELALFNGRDPKSGEQLGPETGCLTDFRDFESLLQAYRRQVEYFARLMVYGCNRGELMQRERGPMPCWSVMTDDCIARGRDINDGGAVYHYHSVCFVGTANVADSLATLKRLLFEEKSVDGAELLSSLKQNFDGAESLREKLLHSTPGYGNDIPEVDELASMICREFIELMDGFRSPLGGRYFVHLFSFLFNVLFGKRTGALPCGRRSEEPLAYSLSAHQGRDVRGITALMNSMSRIPHDMAAGSSAAIIEIDPVVVRGEEGLKRMEQILRTTVNLGIGQIQFNVVTAEQMKQAQNEPEKYGNLKVRVAGYSAKFSTIARDLQDHLIARTKHMR